MIHWKTVEQYITVVLLVLFFQFYPVCNFGKLINFGLATVRSERVNYQFFAVEKFCAVSNSNINFLPGPCEILLQPKL